LIVSKGEGRKERASVGKEGFVVLFGSGQKEKIHASFSGLNLAILTRPILPLKQEADLVAQI
jgi:hypothetical protein